MSQQSAARPQPGVHQAQSGGAISRFFTKFTRSGRDDSSGMTSQAATDRKPVVRFAEIEGGVGVAQQLKTIKDSDAAAAAQKAKLAEERSKLERGETETVNTQILPVDIDRWMPGHWLRSQYLEDIIAGPDSDVASRTQMIQRYADEEAIVSKNAATAFKFGFSKAVRMKMEQDALAAQRLADHEKEKEMMRNRLDTATVFDVKPDFFCRSLIKFPHESLNPQLNVRCTGDCRRTSRITCRE